MIIVDRHCKIIAILFQCLIIFLFVLYILQDGGFVIEAEVKREVVADIA